MLLPVPVSPPAIHARPPRVRAAFNWQPRRRATFAIRYPEFWGISTTFTVPSVQPLSSSPAASACLADVCGVVSFWTGIGGGNGGVL